MGVQVQEGLEDVQHARHLREDQDPVAARFQLAKQHRQRLCRGII